MQVLLTKLDLAKFPFTAEASDYIRAFSVSPEELAKPEFAPILERAVERIKQAVLNGRIPAEQTQEDVDILAYPTALMLISALGDDRIRRRHALAEAKRAYQLLRNENPEKLLQIAVGSFGWDAKLTGLDIGQSHFEFAVRFDHYVRNSARIHDLKWKLVNRILSDGYVLLPRDDFSRLLEEEVQAKAIEKTSGIEVTIPEELARLVEPIHSILNARSKYLADDEMPKTAMASAMPPCMKNLLALLQASKHISHMGRFATAAFLLNIGTTEDELLNMFKSFTDFDERIARYQVEHIAGERGSRTKYTPPKCRTMQTHGLCVNPDELCGTIGHPLSYYRKKARSLMGKERRRMQHTTGNRE